MHICQFGIHVDEVAMAYDAFCLSENGTDRWQVKFPVYFENFGGGQSVLYGYLAAIFIKIFGLNMLSIRLPAFLLSISAIIVLYFTTKKEWGVENAELITFLVTIMPWHIMSSRWGLDCNIFAPMLIIATCLLIHANSIKEYILSGIFFGLTLYTYALSYMIIPMFLLFILSYMLYTKKITIKNIIVLGIPIFILALPLILMILVNNGIIGDIYSFISIKKLPEYRGSEIKISNIIKNIGFIKTIFTNDGLIYNALPEFGTVYNFSIILIFLGILIELKNFYINIKNKEFNISTVMLLLVGSIMICVMLTASPNINKVNAIYMPLMFFIVSAMDIVYKNNKIIFGILISLFIIYFINFEYFYFVKYEAKYGVNQYFERDYLDVIEYVEQRYKNKDIHVFTSTAEPYIYTLFVNKTSAEEFNKGLHQDTIEDDLYSYNNYYFRKIELDGDEICIVNSVADNETYLLLQNVGFKEDEYTKDKQYKVLLKGENK